MIQRCGVLCTSRLLTGKGGDRDVPRWDFSSSADVCEMRVVSVEVWSREHVL